ncbi:DUF488 domain-containing protein [Halpernia sp.]|uniref:DUF488 domain-containing protein n=1 Tax=Halpernia sp. TaxID=2782209 RepID=UPI003A8F36D6
MKVKEKRIYETAEKKDGYRIFVDKLWPRGMKKEDAHFDFWAKEISPSKKLRKSYHGNEIDFKEFSKLYLKELENNPDSKEFLEKIKSEKIITLLTSVKNIETSETPVLKEFIESEI